MVMECIIVYFTNFLLSMYMNVLYAQICEDFVSIVSDAWISVSDKEHRSFLKFWPWRLWQKTKVSF